MLYRRVGASSTSTGLGDASERLGRLAVRVGEHDRPAGVAALAQLGHERQLAEQRHAEVARRARWPPPAPKSS